MPVDNMAPYSLGIHMYNIVLMTTLSPQLAAGLSGHTQEEIDNGSACAAGPWVGDGVCI
jgi:hypothetical protein